MPADDASLLGITAQRILALEEEVARLKEELSAANSSLQRAAVQQALMDERLLALEGNRLFRLWGKVYRSAAGLYARVGAGDRYGGVSDLRTPGDYERWVNHEQEALAAEDHRGTAARWRSQPLITVKLRGDAGGGESVRHVQSVR